MVERLNRLRHDAVICCDHEDRDVGDLRTTGTHGGERLVTGGVDEGDGAVDALVLGVDLVRTDVLGDATGFTGDDVRVADGVEESGLTVVDVTHDRDDGGTSLELFVGFVFELLVEVDVEAFEKLAVLFLRRDDEDPVAEFFTEDAEGRLVEGLRRRRHLTEVEQHGDEVSGAGVDLVGEVRDGCSATQTNGCRAVTAGNTHAAKRRGFPAARIPASSPASTCAPCSCRHRDRMHQRFHRRGHGHDRRHLRGGSGRSSSRVRRGRHRDAGSRHLQRHLDAGSRRRPDGLRRRDAGIRRRRDAGPGLGRRDAVRRGGVRLGEVPAGAGCCSGLEQRDAGPCPARSRTGCCRGAVFGGTLAHALCARERVVARTRCTGARSAWTRLTRRRIRLLLLPALLRPVLLRPGPRLRPEPGHPPSGLPASSGSLSGSAPQRGCRCRCRRRCRSRRRRRSGA